MFKPKDAWWDLTDEEKQQFGKAIGDPFDAGGGKRIVSARREWSEPDYVGLGMQEFPSIEARQRHFDDEYALSTMKYVDSVYMVGTRSAPEDT